MYLFSRYWISLSWPSPFLKMYIIDFLSIILLLLLSVFSKIKFGNQMLPASSGLIRLFLAPNSKLLNFRRSSNHFKNTVNSEENFPATASKEESRSIIIDDWTTILSFSWPSCMNEMLPAPNTGMGSVRACVGCWLCRRMRKGRMMQTRNRIHMCRPIKHKSFSKLSLAYTQ